MCGSASKPVELCQIGCSVRFKGLDRKHLSSLGILISKDSFHITDIPRIYSSSSLRFTVFSVTSPVQDKSSSNTAVIEALLADSPIKTRRTSVCQHSQSPQHHKTHNFEISLINDVGSARRLGFAAVLFCKWSSRPFKKWVLAKWEVFASSFP
jgi:hypothetical protein